MWLAWLLLSLSGVAQASTLRPSAAFLFFENIWRGAREKNELKAEEFSFNVSTWRTLFPATFQALVPELPGSVARPVDISIGQRTIPGHWVMAKGVSSDPKQGMILFFHGGAFVLGDMIMYEHGLQYLSRDTNLPVLFVDYGLAPEFPMPAAVHECVSTYRWVLKSLGVDAGKVIMAGDSAGGGLALLVLQALRSEVLPNPAAAVLLSPWLDLSLSGESFVTNKEVEVMLSDLLLSPQLVRTVARSVPAAHASVSALFGSFDGLPPLYISVGQNEILLSDALRGAQRARVAGVQTHLEVAPHMLHIFPLMGDVFPEAFDARKQITTFIQHHLSGEFVGTCAADEPKPFKVAIIGAGFAGLNMAVNLKKIGASFTVFEAAPGLGGTWLVTKYPGLACDVSSSLYEFSFAFNLNWTHTNPPGAEICNYLNKVAQDFGILPFIQFQHRVSRLEWHESSLSWQLTTEHKGQTTTSEFDAVVSAVGQLNVPNPITDAGAEDFQGLLTHSMHFDRDTSLTGKRVGIVGTGPSAHQIILSAAPQAKELTIFQRSAPWIFPVPQGPRTGNTSAAERAVERETTFSMMESLHPAMIKGSMIWNHLSTQALNSIEANFEPKDYSKVLPDYPFGCKRLVISAAHGANSNAYFETLKLPSVHVETSPIERILPHGVRTRAGKEVPLDILVYAHGYQASKFLSTFQVLGENGTDLHAEEWKGIPRAYLGMTVPGFPNLFVMYGPNTNLGHNSIVAMIEAQAEYIQQIIEQMRCGVKRKFSVKRDAFEAFNKEIQERLDSMIWSDKCSNWYKTKEGLNVVNWPGDVREYQRRLKTPRWADY